MARPRLRKEIVKTEYIQVRFTAFEKEEIKRICQNKKISISKYIRDMFYKSIKN